VFYVCDHVCWIRVWLWRTLQGLLCRKTSEPTATFQPVHIRQMLHRNNNHIVINILLMTCFYMSRMQFIKNGSFRRRPYVKTAGWVVYAAGDTVKCRDLYGYPSKCLQLQSSTCNLCKKNCSVYIQCKGDIVVVDIKQHKSQFKLNSFLHKYLQFYCRWK